MPSISEIRSIAYRMTFEDAGFASGMAKAAASARDTAAAGKEAAAGVGALQKEVSQAGPSAATLNARTDANAKFALAAAAANRRFAAEMVTLRREIDAGRKSTEQAAETERNAGILRDAAIEKAKTNAAAMAKMFGAAGDSAGISTRQFQQLTPQLNDIFTTIAGGMSPLQVLIQQGPQISEIFGGVKATFLAVSQAIGPMRLGVIAAGAAIGGMVAIAESGDAALRNLSNRLRATRDDYASLAATVEATAKSVAASSSISSGDARQAGQVIASSRSFSGNSADLAELLRLAQGVSKVFGEDMPASAARLVSAMKGPAAAAQELAEGGFRTMNEELLRSIERLENQGKKAEAARLVLDAYKRGVVDAATNSTALSRALTSIGDSFQSGFERIRPGATWVVEIFADLLKKVGELDDFANNNALGRLLGLASAGGAAGAGGAPGAAGGAPGGVAAPSTADQINGADALVRKISPASRQRQDIADQAQQLNAALALPGVEGDRAKGYRDSLAALREQLDGLKGPVAQYIEGLRDQAALAGVAEGAARDYAAAEAAVAKIHGGAAAQAEARALVEKRLNGEMMNSLFAFNRQSVAADDLAAAQGKGADAVREVEAATRAETEALKFAEEGTAKYEKLVLVLTSRYTGLAEAQARGRSNAAALAQTNQLDMLQKESDLVGATEATRTRELAVLQETQKLKTEGIKTDEASYAVRIKNAGAIADASTALARQKDAWSEIQNIGTQAFDRIGAAVTAAFAQGKAGAVSFGTLAKAILSEILQSVLKLAILRPVMNAVLGTNYGTLYNAGGAASSLFSGGGGSTGAATPAASGSSGGMGISDYASLASTAYKLSGGSISGAYGTVGGSVSSFLASPAYAYGGAEIIPAGAAYYGEAAAAGSVGSATTGGAAGVGGAVSYGAALGGAAGIAGGAYGIYSGLKRGGPGGYTTAVGGAVSMGAGAAMLGAFGPGLAALGPYGLAAAAVIMIVGSMLKGQKPSNMTGTAALDIASGDISTYGQTGKKYSAANQEAATGIAGSFAKIATSLQTMTGVHPDGRLTVDVGNRDGIGFNYLNPARGMAVSGKFGNDDEGYAAAMRAGTVLMLQSIRSELPNAISSAISGIQMDTTESIVTGLAKIAEATGAKPSAAQNIAADHIDFTNLDAGIEELKWVRDTYDVLTSAAKPVGAFDQSMAALNKSWQDAIDHAGRLGLATDGLSASWATATTKAVDERNANVNTATNALWIRLARAQGGSSEASDLFEFDNAAEGQRRSFAAQFEAWGLSAEQTAERMALLEKTLGAERLSISQSYADKITANEKAKADAETQKRDAATQTAGGVVSSLADYARGLRTGDASPLSATAQYAGASGEFNAVYGAAMAGDATSIGKLSSYADTLLKTSRAIYGSGVQYAADYQRVIEAIGGIASKAADELTASFYAAQVQSQTTTLSGDLVALRDEVTALRREIALNGMRPAA